MELWDEAGELDGTLQELQVRVGELLDKAGEL